MSRADFLSIMIVILIAMGLVIFPILWRTPKMHPKFFATIFRVGEDGHEHEFLIGYDYDPAETVRILSVSLTTLDGPFNVPRRHWEEMGIRPGDVELQAEILDQAEAAIEDKYKDR